MGKSDDSLSLLSGDSSPPPPPLTTETKRSWKRRKLIVYEDDEDEEEPNQLPLPALNRDDEVGVEVKPIGNVVRVSGEGESRRNHFKGFEVNGVCYELEDNVLVTPKEHSINMKPSVVTIKDISVTKDGRISVTGACFYRPEDAKMENWKSREARELFYSFDEIEFPPESVMHKCQVYFIPTNLTIPSAEQHPGFIVQKIYDEKSKRLCAIVDDADNKNDITQMELIALVQKTIERIPSLPLTPI